MASYTTGIKAISTQSLIGVKVIDEFKNVKKEDLRFGINKSKPLLKSILDKSLSTLDDQYLSSLANSWILRNESGKNDNETTAQ